MRTALAIGATAEALTGLVLLIYPPILVRLLFGAEIAGVGTIISRIAGISLIGLGVACWPPRSGGGVPRALLGMLTYGTLAAIYLGYLGIMGAWTGKLLWPAVAGHVILTILLAWTWPGLMQERNGSSPG